jgi:putative transcriptional regulator
VTTRVQRVVERQRAIYETLAKPLLQQLVELHGLSIRDFARIFEISKGHAEAVLKHRTEPSLELAFRIARYFDLTVDDLFGWRFDDTGDRRPLLIHVPGKAIMRVNTDFSALELVKRLEEEKKEQ